MERKNFSLIFSLTLCVRAFSDSVLLYYNTTSPICQMQEFYTNKWYCVFSRAKCSTWAKQRTVQFKSGRMIQKKHNSVFFDHSSKWMKETGHNKACQKECVEWGSPGLLFCTWEYRSFSVIGNSWLIVDTCRRTPAHSFSKSCNGYFPCFPRRHKFQLSIGKK